MHLTYPGWQKDCIEAEKDHLSPIHLSSIISSTFERSIEGIKRKQTIFIGDRSHGNLQRLDSLKLTYPNWKDDFKDAMQWFMKGYSIDDELYSMTETQSMFEGNRTHPRLVALDSLKLTTLGGKKTLQNVRNYIREPVWMSTTDLEHCLPTSRGSSGSL